MEIRYYSKSRLAQIYFGHLCEASARKRLMRWINGCQPLCEELRKANYNPSSRGFTPRQVKIILEYLGNPDLE